MEMGKGNYALAGHNMSNLGPKVLFSPLYYRAKVGQKIYLTDMKNVYTYKITCDLTLAKNFAAKAAEEINAKKNYDFDQDIILLRQYRFNRYLVGQEPSDTQWD